MTTRERLEMLAPAIARFPEMGEFGSVEALRELVRTELGGEEALDPPVNSLRAPRHLLHIISANTALAGMQSLARGLILGSRNDCKTPASGLPRFEEFLNMLPPALHALVEVSPHLPPKWLERADAIVVFGSDETVEFFRRQLRPGQIFAGYGNRWSGAVIFDDPAFASIDPLAQDICLYQQMGCLSAQIVWLHASIDAVEYGRRLAAALQRFGEQHRIAALALPAAASVARWRLSAEWQVVENPRNHVWLSQAEPCWGVLLLGGPQRPGWSCLHRHVTLATFANTPDLGELSGSVSTLGIWPLHEAHARKLASSGASRICAAGTMQFPHPTWQQDGFPALGRLVRRG